MNTQNPQQLIEEDEIDLRELWKSIVNGKKIIAIVTTVIVSLTFVYALKMPNVYTSEAILMPTSEESSVSLGGLGGLAAMAGVSIGGGGSMTPDVAFNSLLGDYEFMRGFVIKNKVLEHYLNPELDKNYVFALGFRGLYDLFNSPVDLEELDKEEEIYELIEKIQKNFLVSADKKSGLITISYSDSDREYPPVIIEAFLEDASAYLVQNNLGIIDHKLHYFESELAKSESFELRESISALYSKIIQEKVMLKSKKYYQCDVLTAPAPAYIKDKSKPKRGLILVVSFVTSIILGVFLVFFLEFIKNSKEEDSSNE